MSDIKQKARELLGDITGLTNAAFNEDGRMVDVDDALRAIEAALRTSTPDAGGRDAEDAARYRWLRRKFCIISGKDRARFEAVNLPFPRYVAPNPAIEMDAVIDAAIPQRERS
ncbi:hypothetical protein ACYX7E_10165 [Luteimonas sp. RIT-PG2_3]